LLKSHLDSDAHSILSGYIQAKGNVGLSTGVYNKGQEYFYNYGETKQGNNQLPTNRTLYDIGSITKTFTATLLAIAVDQGKATLTTPIYKLLPDSVTANPALKSITLDELANHTSGLARLPPNITEHQSDSNQPYWDYDEQQLFSALRHLALSHAPGTNYDYSNFGAGLLGVLMEIFFHQPYQQLVNKYILLPAAMTQSHFQMGVADQKLLAQGYNEQLQAVPSWNFQALQAAGAIKSSSSDLLAYGKLQLGSANETLNKALKLTHQITYDHGSNVIGLGWQYLPDNRRLLQHSGGTGGYRSIVCVDLDRNIVVIVLTNNAKRMLWVFS
jgi:CubicO group peptidase (beta-lactamase class C family)